MHKLKVAVSFLAALWGLLWMGGEIFDWPSATQSAGPWMATYWIISWIAIGVYLEGKGKGGE